MPLLAGPFWLRRPGPEQLETLLDRQREADLSYPAVGATRDTPPPATRWSDTNANHPLARLGGLLSRLVQRCTTNRYLDGLRDAVSKQEEEHPGGCSSSWLAGCCGSRD